ncbi:MAG: hypothetical protein OER82_00100 [Nitrosopumilus sp.]|nr:hypothetical protein [Nitrosopumilus sp.]
MEKKTRHLSSLKISCSLSNGIHHGNEITDEYVGEIICNSCGVVLEEKILSYKIHEKERVSL